MTFTLKVDTNVYVSERFKIILASCKSLILVLIFVYKPSFALGKTLFLLIMFLSTITCLSCTIKCVHSFKVLKTCAIQCYPIRVRFQF